MLQQLLVKQPDNAELWFQLGLTQRFQKKHDEAMKSQQKAITLSPNNQDIRLELARLHYWHSDYDTAESMVEEVLSNTPEYESAQKLSSSIQKAKQGLAHTREHLWQLDTGYEHSSFSRRHQPDWTYSFVQLGHWVEDDTLIHVRAEDYERRREHNQHIEIGAAHIFDKTYSAYGAIGYTPDSSFIPEWRFKAGGDVRLIYEDEYLGNTWFTLAAQHDRYTNLNTTVVKPGLRYEFLEVFQFHGQYINVFDEDDKRLKGWSTRLDWQTLIEELRLFGGLADAPESEDAIIYNTKARYAGFVYQFTPTVAVHGSIAREDREDTFIRHVASTALSIKF